MATWDDLDSEISLWDKLENPVTFWWRDDDAIEPTDALDRLLTISFDSSAPCTIAVVPNLLHSELVSILNLCPLAFPAQHGYEHINHAPKGEKAAEFGDHRTRSLIETELRDGWACLSGFDRLAPVFVPPWNRMTDDLNAYLASLGFKGVSQHAPRKSEIAKGELKQVNTHVDIINWRTNRRFVGEDKALNELISHLSARRLGSVDSEEPTGVLTHHLDHDNDCWNFMDKLLRWTFAKSNVRWLTPFEAFKIDAPDYELDL